jgi:1-phosphatidylinositol-4-phosphate 5-kinase
MVLFGHQNWNLVLNMMLGIQKAVKSVSNFLEAGDFANKEFKVKYYFELIPKRIGYEKSSFKICKFQDYAP